jgi:hypothetical protein
MLNLHGWLDTLISAAALGAEIWIVIMMRREESRPATKRKYWPYLVAMAIIAMVASIPGAIVLETLHGNEVMVSKTQYDALNEKFNADESKIKSDQSTIAQLVGMIKAGVGFGGGGGGGGPCGAGGGGAGGPGGNGGNGGNGCTIVPPNPATPK